MKTWLYLIALIVLMFVLAGCAPVEVLETEPAETAPSVVATAVPTPSPLLPTATVPPATTEPNLPVVPEAVQAAVRFLATRFSLDPGDIQVLQVTPVEWPDACLGMPAQEDMCAQAITPGYVITLEAVVAGDSQHFTFHTDASGGALHLIPEAVVAARQALIDQTGIPLEQIRLVQVEYIEWRDSCLGVTMPGVNCLDVIVPGYRIILAANSMQYEYHTNQDGSWVVLVPGLRN